MLAKKQVSAKSNQENNMNLSKAGIDHLSKSKSQILNIHITKKFFIEASMSQATANVTYELTLYIEDYDAR